MNYPVAIYTRKYLIATREGREIYRGSKLPPDIKQLLKTSDNYLRFDSVGEYKLYLKLISRFGLSNVTPQYLINKLFIKWKVDFKVRDIHYEYKVHLDANFNKAMQALADYYPTLLKSLIVVSPTLNFITVRSDNSGMIYNLKTIKIEDI